jgi:hypothetical protein
MRTSDALYRLAAAAPALLSQTESLVGPSEEEQILERILASSRREGRSGARQWASRRVRVGLLLATFAAVATAVAVGSIGSGRRNPPATRSHRHLALSGARIELAGYRFRTPAGFKASTSSCAPASEETPARNGFVAAASADGGCVEAVALIAANSSAIPTAAQPVAVGSYQGWLVSQAPSGDTTLYVELPNAAGDQRAAYLVLFAQGLTQEQLIDVAESGLPTLPLRPTTTTQACTTNCG